MTDMRLSEKLEEVLGLAAKATPGVMVAFHGDPEGEETCGVAPIGKSDIADCWLNHFRPSEQLHANADLIAAAINLLRDHGEDLRQALRDSERLNAAPVGEVTSFDPAGAWMVSKDDVRGIYPTMRGQRVRLVIEAAAMGRREGEA